jgi:acetyl-CoA carboxylase carboxyl transferase subunit alpha
MHLAEKFKHPLVIFVPTRVSLPESGLREPSEALAFAQHLRTLYQLKVPTLLVILGRRGDSNIFGSWIADRIIVAEHSSFAMTLLGRQLNSSLVFIKAKSLKNYRIVDYLLQESFPGANLIPGVIAEGVRESIKCLLCELLPIPQSQLECARAARAARVMSFDPRNVL